MEIKSLQRELQNNAYPGRGIVIGRTPDGKYAVTAYFIMGRSVNSRNRIFVEEGEGIRTEAFDPSQLSDPSLIIYAPVRVLGRRTIVTNGDQTDTIYDGQTAGKSFEETLAARKFEPDAPNYTPRISGIMELAEGAFSYKMSILKSADGDPSCCCRYTFSYDKPLAGEGPLPGFEGEPTRVAVDGEDIDSFAKGIWESLDEENKVSLFVRYIEIETGRYESRIINKNV